MDRTFGYINVYQIWGETKQSRTIQGSKYKANTAAAALIGCYRPGACFLAYRIKVKLK